MTHQTNLIDLATALYVLSQEIDSDDGIANAVCAEASQRLRQIWDDLSAAKKLLADEAKVCTRKSNASRKYEAALLRLVAEVAA